MSAGYVVRLSLGELTMLEYALKFRLDYSFGRLDIGKKRKAEYKACLAKVEAAISEALRAP